MKRTTNANEDFLPFEVITSGMAGVLPLNFCYIFQFLLPLLLYLLPGAGRSKHRLQGKIFENQKAVDFLMLEDPDSVGFLELENGFIITETRISPHGTGMAGLNYYDSIAIFEENCGGNYKRLKNYSL